MEGHTVLSYASERAFPLSPKCEGSNLQCDRAIIKALELICDRYAVNLVLLNFDTVNVASNPNRQFGRARPSEHREWRVHAKTRSVLKRHVVPGVRLAR